VSEPTIVNPLEQPITIILSAGEINYLLQALGRQPFAEVAALIGKIKVQGDAQFAPPSSPSPGATEDPSPAVN
jgi:hypothetical protein